MYQLKYLSALALAGALTAAGAATAQSTYGNDATKNAPGAAQSQTPSDRMATKPMIPSKSETPDSAFKKLDPAGKGYVTKDDVQGLNGFNAAFQQNDANRDGQLTQEEFRRAWTTYSGNPN
jgi:Ca2+-binding EF-hand superfamily protein